MTRPWLLRQVEVDGALVDCRIADESVQQVAPRLEARGDERVLDGAGGALLPGLADHHLHLRALAAARRSLDLAGGDTGSVAEPPGDGWLRIVGAGQDLTRAELDARWPARPVRVQHRSGALWTLNSAALDRLTGPLDDTERRTGQFWRAGGRLRVLLGPAAGVVTDDELAALGRELLAHGVTHLTDATPDGDAPAHAVPQHVTGLAASGSGPRKIVLPDHVSVDPDELARRIAAEHDRDRGVAVHVVTAGALAVLLAAWRAVGVHPGDRVEHAAVCSDAAAGGLAELGVPVVTQPSVFARHGARFRAESDPDERPLLWRYAGLLRAGVGVAISSDAPYGDADPWAGVRAAATALTPDERVAPATALASLLADPLDPGGPPRRVGPGSAADLCLLHEPLREFDAGFVAPVRATFVAGHCVHLVDSAV